jgi:drug/metabolite transporter (DMT)-like permease
VPIFLVAGVYLLCFSGLALFCSFTSWAAMASLWPLFVTFLGVVLVALFFFREKRRAYLLTGLLLISLSAVFSVTQTFGAHWWWTILILAGLSILVAEKAK